MNVERRARTRALNDQLRRYLIGGRILLTPGITSNGQEAVRSVMAAVAAFDSFSADNDPYDEHDFGAVELEGQSVFWKISYYDPSLTMHAEDPSDPETCVRVLTVMLAEEY